MTRPTLALGGILLGLALATFARGPLADARARVAQAQRATQIARVAWYYTLPLHEVAAMTPALRDGYAAAIPNARSTTS